jgi:hypothetical protein
MEDETFGQLADIDPNSVEMEGFKVEMLPPSGDTRWTQMFSRAYFMYAPGLQVSLPIIRARFKGLEPELYEAVLRLHGGLSRKKKEITGTTRIQRPPSSVDSSRSRDLRMPISKASQPRQQDHIAARSSQMGPNEFLTVETCRYCGGTDGHWGAECLWNPDGNTREKPPPSKRNLARRAWGKAHNELIRKGKGKAKANQNNGFE